MTDELEHSAQASTKLLLNASLLYAGRRIPVSTAELTIGRGDDNDLVLSGARISRAHACIRPNEHGHFLLVDLKSQLGTVLNGDTFRDEERVLQSGDTISIDGEVLRFLSGAETRAASRELPLLETQVIQLEGDRLTLGRDPTNDVVLEDPNVSRFHAEIVRLDGKVELVDLGSRNGTRLSGDPVERAVLDPRAEVGIGPYKLTFDGTALVARDERGAMQLDARELVVETRRSASSIASLLPLRRAKWLR